MSEYYTRPSTAPRAGQAIGSALQNFLLQKQNAQKMALLQQQAQWDNPNREPGQLDYLKSTNPFIQLQMMQDPKYIKAMQALMGNMQQSQQATPTQPAQAPTTTPTQGTDNQAKIAALIEELYQARKAKGDSNATQ